MSDPTKPKQMPKFEHDCSECMFLGRYAGRLWNHSDVVVDVDLYYHSNDLEVTVIARHGDDGPAYISGLPFAENGSSPVLVEALARYEAMKGDTNA